MIRTELEYQQLKKRAYEEQELIKKQRIKLKDTGLTQEQIDEVLEPILCFHEQIKEEITFYERIKVKDFDSLYNFNGIGRQLIALRIAAGMSQKELANRLKVSEAQVSKDERNEYHGISIEKTQRVLEALGAELVTKVNDLSPEKAVV